MKRNVTLLIAAVAFSSLANATKPLKTVLKQVQSQSAKSRTIGAYLNSQKKNMTPADFKFLSSQFAAWKILDRSPRFTIKGADSIRVEYHGSADTLRVISLKDRQFAVNGKVLDFTGDSAEIMLKKIRSALPKPGFALISLLLPEAQADDDAFDVFSASIILATVNALGADQACDQLDERIKECQDTSSSLDKVSSVPLPEQACPEHANNLGDLLRDADDAKKSCTDNTAQVQEWQACLDGLRQKMIRLCPSIKGLKVNNGSFDETGTFQSGGASSTR